MRGLLALVAAVSVAGVTVPDSWLHNPRERTAAGLAASRRGDGAAAARAFDEALALAPGDPELTFNAGTGQLLAGAPGAALPLLEKAAASEAAPAALRADALYNLGNARLRAGDPAAAVQAYEACLRLAPEHAAAKHNLELALRQLKEKKPPPQPNPSQGGEGQGGEQQGPQGQQQPRQQGQPDPQGGEPREGEGQEGGDPQQPQPGGGDAQAPRSPRLPQFAPQEDMSADQAAALLEAVENLEREQRRATAEEQRRQRARQVVEKDW